MSHTEGVNLRIAIDGKPATEVHLAAWRTGLPILGVTGDAILAKQLDQGLEETPFSTGKRSGRSSKLQRQAIPKKRAARR